MIQIADSIAFFDNFNCTLYKRVLNAKKQPKKNKFKRKLSIKTISYGNNAGFNRH